MLPRLLDKTADTPRDRILWGVIITLLVAQVIAFWMLCNHQVKKAEARDATLQVERTALADCMQYIPKATMSGCANRVTPKPMDTPDNSATASRNASQTALGNTTPVSFAFTR